MDRSTSTPLACRVAMAVLSTAKPPSAELFSCRPAWDMLREPGTYTMVGEKKPRKRRVTGRVAAEEARRLSLRMPSAPLRRA
jgi:hypothetical protein